MKDTSLTPGGPSSNAHTFLHPEFSKTVWEKDISEWIIAIGRHEGFIEGKNWVAAQTLKLDIADRYNRPHRATNALLAGPSTVRCAISA